MLIGGLKGGIGFVITRIIASIVAFWRASRPKSSTGMEILAYIFMYLFVSGLPDSLIANGKLTIWYILFAILSIKFFVMRKANNKTATNRTKNFSYYKKNEYISE